MLGAENTKVSNHQDPTQITVIGWKDTAKESQNMLASRGESECFSLWRVGKAFRKRWHLTEPWRVHLIWTTGDWGENFGRGNSLYKDMEVGEVGACVGTSSGPVCFAFWRCVRERDSQTVNCLEGFLQRWEEEAQNQASGDEVLVPTLKLQVQELVLVSSLFFNYHIPIQKQMLLILLPIYILSLVILLHFYCYHPSPRAHDFCLTLAISSVNI